MHNQEIKLCGRCSKTNEWLEDLQVCSTNEYLEPGITIVTQDDWDEENDKRKKVTLVTQTVCYNLGIKDINGAEFYTNDLALIKGKVHRVTPGKFGRFHFQPLRKGNAITVIYPLGDLCVKCEKIEKIGNYIASPELYI